MTTTQADGPAADNDGTLRVQAFQNDEWTLDVETLGFDVPAEQLARMVLHAHPPFAASVEGRWGSGKTSIMRYAMAKLGGVPQEIRLPLSPETIHESSYRANQERAEKISKRSAPFFRNLRMIPFSLVGSSSSDTNTDADPDPSAARPSRDSSSDWEPTSLGRVATVWFSAWRHQNDPNPMVPLLHTICDHFTGWAKTRQKLSTLGRATVDAGLEMLGGLIASAAKKSGFWEGTAPNVRESWERASAKDFTQLTDSERFNLVFERAIRTLLEVDPEAESENESGAPKTSADDPPPHRLVLFIDDLDRCEGETAVRMLEAIKLHLSTPYCVFVLGIDRPALEEAVRGQWATRPHGMAREYLDKLFQATLHVPTSTRYPAFIRKWLTNTHEGRTDPGSGSPAGDQTLAQALGDEEAQQTFAEALASILEPRPRKVKNFLNGLLLAWRSRVNRDLTVAHDLLDFALLHRLQEMAPSTYSLLVQDPETYLGALNGLFGEIDSPSTPETGGLKDGEAPSETVTPPVFQHEFFHLLPPATSPPPEHGLAERRFRVEHVGADAQLVRLWVTPGFDPRRVRDLLGLPAAPENTNPANENVQGSSHLSATGADEAQADDDPATPAQGGA